MSGIIASVPLLRYRLGKQHVKTEKLVDLSGTKSKSGKLSFKRFVSVEWQNNFNLSVSSGDGYTFLSQPAPPPSS
jgi:hypothetical protein